MDLLREIEDYTVMVKSIDDFFKKKYAINDVLRAVREKLISKEGEIYLNGFAEYNFHGIGCRIRWEDKTVNFDYSFYIEGFEIGMFASFDIFEFVKSKYKDFTVSLDDITLYLDNLVSENRLIKIENRYLLNHSINKDLFISEFVNRDLVNVDSLEYLQWRLKGTCKMTRQEVVEMLSSAEGRKALNNEKIRNLINKYAESVNYPKYIRNTDDIIDFFNSNNVWFNLIFK
ncbi:hypothetical protein FACS1894182_11780 [Bacteroidia bacterium]|nr:hypothetical protein FACS1894182_11780 [Bacteroidia bacterium]